ncbi:hypothetical protein PRK78_001723 [Emydomyces testavorans]|uniref:Uncharacterized protein n=1 Tax=Emydomyces testavorans TaxID=2070801 RepID=A0AAF0DDB1_9EURO|nr:hypothetical protein PRK78_001723 [Emydomyces testavorans]
MRLLAKRNGRTLLHGLSPRSRAHTASASQKLLSQLDKTLTNQPLYASYDYLSPQPSHLLRVSLADFLPPSQSIPFVKNDANAFSLPSVLESRHMPRGHHLVYFPPQLPSSQLLPDGCDILHSPGTPFNRRMWAGGSVRFRDQNGGLILNGQRAVCLEGVRDVRVTGREGDEKVFVGVERRIATVKEKEDEESIRSRIWAEESEEDWRDARVIEKRNLVFMREKSSEQIAPEKSQQRRILRGEYRKSQLEHLTHRISG